MMLNVGISFQSPPPKKTEIKDYIQQKSRKFPETGLFFKQGPPGPTGPYKPLRKPVFIGLSHFLHIFFLTLAKSQPFQDEAAA